MYIMLTAVVTYLFSTYKPTWTAGVWTRSGFRPCPGTRRATKLWRRTVTLGAPGSRAVPTSHRARAPLHPRAPVAVDFDNDLKIGFHFNHVCVNNNKLEK